MPEHDPGVDHRYQYPQGGTDWARIEAMTDEEALQNALNDPDNPPLTDEQLARMRRVPNPQWIRENLGLTQREFARRFELSVANVRDWEEGSRRPDSTAQAYLRVIQHDPDIVRAALDRSYTRQDAPTAATAPPARAASR
jgi:putative transcriptional regulator